METRSAQGLTAVISVKVPEPEFEGQTKNRLGNPEVRGIVDQVVNEELIKVFEWHPKVSQSVWRGELVGERWGGGGVGTGAETALLKLATVVATLICVLFSIYSSQ